MASSDNDISYSDLKSILAKGSAVLVDVRTNEEVARGTIPGSIHIPVGNIGQDLSLDAAEFQSKFGVGKPPLDCTELVFFCQLGRRGAAATEKAKSLGFKNARNYAGAYKEWSEKEGK
ncbi:thiosulfate:glutathione sulfurtransferase [Danio rerio]|uniref:Novel protein similar to human KAT protein n=1 Tax=Danio rerio TaxID=7955 RepID=B8A5G0_DANRE|nr:thiosulfate sulfurtransferase/rhodanese-like domain-containing protein 1 isoform X1 [Danio rerio]CAX12846.1 novel protein similar to human KAT protein [Danio rerio]|eukprot:XP_021328471.1 thiosulfate sulfurtransferase/rhodanese-like domain-containing protein 1 isoform X1 [Danio rerio]